MILTAKIFTGIFLNVEEFFVLRLLHSFLISDKVTSLNKSGVTTPNEFLIVKILGWFLDLKTALSSGSKPSFTLLLNKNFQLCWDLQLIQPFS